MFSKAPSGAAASSSSSSSSKESESKDAKMAAEAKKWQALKKEIEQLKSIRSLALKTQKAKEFGKQFFSLQAYFGSDTVLLKEYVEVSGHLFQYMNAMDEALEQSATLYFKQLFAEQKKELQGEPVFLPKLAGNQLGKKMRVKFREEKVPHEISYYIKTHQHGSQSGASSARPVDPKELLIYKILEKTGLGPKVHFFFNSLSQGGFYIATQDTSYTKDIQKKKTFSTYSELKEALDKEKPTHIEYEKGIALMDIFSRIFVLRDVATNPSNFGLVMVNSQRCKWKIVDFRIIETSNYNIPGLFPGWLAGNGMYNYTGYMSHVLKDRPEAQRVATVGRAISELEQGRLTQKGGGKMPLQQAIIAAFFEIAKYVAANAPSMGIVNLNEVLGDLGTIDLNGVSIAEFSAKFRSLSPQQAGDLGRYVQAVMKNFEELAAGVKKHQKQLKAKEGGSSETATSSAQSPVVRCALPNLDGLSLGQDVSPQLQKKDDKNDAKKDQKNKLVTPLTGIANTSAGFSSIGASTSTTSSAVSSATSASVGITPLSAQSSSAGTSFGALTSSVSASAAVLINSMSSGVLNSSTSSAMDVASTTAAETPLINLFSKKLCA